jgi:TonB-dependent SusC/RagA subfamily outer membrane receptor
MAVALVGLLFGTNLASAQEPAGSITGRVFTEAGVPLADAHVSLVGTQRGTLSNARGSFLIPNVPAGARQVQVTILGYRTLTQTVQVEAGSTATIDFHLATSAISLDEIVVTGQATSASRREIGTSIASIDVGALESAPVQTMSQLLQARAPGVNVLPGGGKSGQGTRIVLRGAASVSQSNEPLIYVDGVRIDKSSADGISTTTSGASWSGLDDINPDDIERIEIVRGASAATLYGTEAAAGVIQIFTKRGAEGQSVWNYSGEAGILHTPLEWWDVSEYSPWFYDHMVQRGHTQSHQLSVRGGAQNISYYISGSMRDEKGVLPKDGQQSYSFRMNLGLVPREDLSIRLSTSFNDRSVRVVPDANNTRGYTINGLVGGPRGQFVRTESLTAIRAFQEGSRFLAGLTLEHQPASFVTQRLTLGADIWNQDQHQLFPYQAIANLPEGYRTNYRRESRNLNLDYAVTTRFDLTEDLRSTTAAGFQYLSYDVGFNEAVGDDFPFFGLETVNATLRTTGYEGRLQEKSAGFFAEQQFAFRDYLFLTAGARADGHSAFGADVDYQIYPKASLSYVLSDHLTLPEQINVFRLRGAYGTAGQQPRNFAAVRSWTSTSALGGQPAVVPSNLGNPDLKPEVTHEMELGFELSVLESRLNLDLTRYTQETRDALYAVREPPSQGVLTTQLRTVGEVRNEGWEVGVRGTVIDLPSVRWEALANYSTNATEIVSLGGGSPIQLQWLQWMREGYPVGAFFGDRPIEHNGQVGMASELLKNPDGSLPEGWDYIGPPLPTRTIQLGSTFNFGTRTTFSFLFDHRGGAYAQSSTMRWLMQPNQDITQAALDAHADLGYPNVATTGPVARVCRNPDKIQEIICGRNSALTHGDFAMPIDFWKLREMSLSYRTPDAWPERLGLSSLTLTLAGRNLWRSTEYLGLEPEGMYRGDLSDSAVRSQTFFDTPIPRRITIGVQAQF